MSQNTVDWNSLSATFLKNSRSQSKIGGSRLTIFVPFIEISSLVPFSIRMKMGLNITILCIVAPALNFWYKNTKVDIISHALYIYPVLFR